MDKILLVDLSNFGKIFTFWTTKMEGNLLVGLKKLTKFYLLACQNSQNLFTFGPARMDNIFLFVPTKIDKVLVVGL